MHAYMVLDLRPDELRPIDQFLVSRTYISPLFFQAFLPRFRALQKQSVPDLLDFPLVFLAREFRRPWMICAYDVLRISLVVRNLMHA